MKSFVKKTTVIGLALFVITGLACVDTNAESQKQQQQQEQQQQQQQQLLKDRNTLALSNNEFAFDLYAKLLKKTDKPDDQENLFFSPYSISTALAMTYAGARTDTAAQMADVFHFNLPGERLHVTFAELQKMLNNSAPAPEKQKPNYQLNVANALWGQKDYGFLDSFLALNRKYYDAGLNELDFVKQTEKSRQTINKWVEDKTAQKIKNLIPKGVLDNMTRLVLTNAIYFKGDWATEFDKKSTRPAPFHINKDKTTQAPLMYQKKDFKYAQLEGLQILELPYKGEDLSMIVLLPEEIDGLTKLEKSLNAQKLDEYCKKFRKQSVKVFLPRFKMTSQFSLAQQLAQMGMPLAFSMKADFSGMDGTKELFLSAVIHKAFVEVNEQGTEAAAATGAVMSMKSAFPSEPVFRADHPFMLLIQDNRTGSILFMGHLTNPTE
ncbi:MAG: serpin family protein [Sedimentisphaerales bacterium]|nr:serpin family protein [Sedimentisphaerales bacterium]